ncbi:MBL fold metallo-hydrolase [Mucilaginibacter gossypii]|uniref:MBL fold metallo-hydrolase n=1 Tax=Mucilaginibacter gossypii TaxID=551996 RepID=UPI000DCD7A4E|nr:MULTISPECIES: MBL fold metallo-hydrolase [Mucilaginibacter]QTE38556.1 MBL fold metallo-hydrolase [Mucilaginibacter gossypii]RAV52834.1 MBL fold metallo-hydrolase [Mucilaginibacter rubeus]
MNTNDTHINRRSFLASAGLLTAGAILSPRLLFGQKVIDGPVQQINRAAATAKINVTKLRGNIFMVEGSGGNIAVLNGPQGKLLVDAGIDVSKAHVAAALKTISNKPIKVLINSHWHFDHTSGNDWLHDAGATIISQDITRDHLTKRIFQPEWNYTFEPLPKGGIPTITYKNEYKKHFNGENILVKTYQPAHTDADSSIYFPNADILHVADTFWNGYYPFIDYATGGSIDGMITAAAQNVANTNKHTIVIPGHGPIGNHAQLVQFHDMLATIRERVASLKKQGRDLKGVIAAKPTASFDPVFGNFVIKGDFFAKLVFTGV